MRTLLTILLLLPATALAADDFAARLRALDEQRETELMQARARVSWRAGQPNDAFVPEHARAWDQYQQRVVDLHQEFCRRTPSTNCLSTNERRILQSQVRIAKGVEERRNAWLRQGLSAEEIRRRADEYRQNELRRPSGQTDTPPGTSTGATPSDRGGDQGTVTPNGGTPGGATTGGTGTPGRDTPGRGTPGGSTPGGVSPNLGTEEDVTVTAGGSGTEGGTPSGNRGDATTGTQGNSSAGTQGGTPTRTEGGTTTQTEGGTTTRTEGGTTTRTEGGTTTRTEGGTTTQAEGGTPTRTGGGTTSRTEGATPAGTEGGGERSNPRDEAKRALEAELEQLQNEIATRIESVTQDDRDSITPQNRDAVRRAIDENLEQVLTRHREFCGRFPRDPDFCLSSDMIRELREAAAGRSCFVDRRIKQANRRTRDGQTPILLSGHLEEWQALTPKRCQTLLDRDGGGGPNPDGTGLTDQENSPRNYNPTTCKWVTDLPRRIVSAPGCNSTSRTRVCTGYVICDQLEGEGRFIRMSTCRPQYCGPGDQNAVNCTKDLSYFSQKPPQEGREFLSPRLKNILSGQGSEQ